jgi:hypothetical protein
MHQIIIFDPVPKVGWQKHGSVSVKANATASKMFIRASSLIHGLRFGGKRETRGRVKSRIQAIHG